MQIYSIYILQNNNVIVKIIHREQDNILSV